MIVCAGSENSLGDYHSFQAGSKVSVQTRLANERTAGKMPAAPHTHARRGRPGRWDASCQPPATLVESSGEKLVSPFSRLGLATDTALRQRVARTIRRRAIRSKALGSWPGGPLGAAVSVTSNGRIQRPAQSPSVAVSRRENSESPPTGLSLLNMIKPGRGTKRLIVRPRIW
jgi:hypothetical protein